MLFQTRRSLCSRVTLSRLLRSLALRHGINAGKEPTLVTGDK
jgi:hypothetical protein